MNLETSVSFAAESSDSRHAFDVINQDFSDGVLTATVVIDTGDVSSAPVQGAISTLTASVESDGFFGSSKLETNQAGDLAYLPWRCPVTSRARHRRQR